MFQAFGPAARCQLCALGFWPEARLSFPRPTGAVATEARDVSVSETQQQLQRVCADNRWTTSFSTGPPRRPNSPTTMRPPRCRSRTEPPPARRRCWSAPCLHAERRPPRCRADSPVWVTSQPPSEPACRRPWHLAALHVWPSIADSARPGLRHASGQRRRGPLPRARAAPDANEDNQYSTQR